MNPRATEFRLSLVALALGAALLAGCGDNPAKLVASGKEYLAKGDDKAAVIQLKNALQKEPDNGEARLLLGEAQLRTGDFPAAEKELVRALELGRSPDVVLPLLAQALFDQGKVAELVKTYGTRTLQNPAAQARLQAYLGDAYVAQNKLGEASAAYNLALASVKDDAQARTGLARVMAVQGDLPGALKLADAVVAAAPGFAPAAMLKADLQVALGDRAAALKTVDAGIQGDPKFVPLRLAKVSALIDANELDAAAKAIEEARPVAGGDLRLVYLEGLLAYRKGDNAKAAESTAAVLKAAPTFVPALALMGALDLQAGRYAQAENNLRQVLSIAPAHTGARRLLVATYLRSSQPTKASEALQPLVDSRQPQDPQILLLAGETYLATGDSQKAATYYQAAADAKADKSAAAARTRLGQIALAGGNSDVGFRELEAASELDPQQVQADLALVTSHLRRKEYDKALAAARNLQKKQPSNPLSYQIEGLVFVGKQEPGAARKAFERALELQPTYLPAAYALASLDLADKKPDQAKARYEKMIAKDPKNDQLYVALAELIGRSGGSPADVTATLQKGAQANPAAIDARLALVRYSLQRGDAKAAVAAASEAVAAQPNDRRALEAMAAAQEANGDLNQAVEALRKLATVTPESPQPQMQLAALYVRQKQFDRAYEALVAAKKLAPANETIDRDIVATLLAGGKPEEALRAARQAQRERPKSGLPLLFEGEVLESQGKLAEAEQAYRAGLKLQPTTGALAVRLYALLQKAGKKADAEAFAKRWLTDNPKDIALRLYLAEQDMRARNLKGAAANYQAVIAVQPDQVVALNNLAWVAGEMGDPKAIGYAERAVQLAPNSGAVLDTYGMLLVKKGDVDKGVEVLGRAVRAAPNRPEIRLNYARALVKQGRKDDARKELQALQESKADFPGKAEIPELLKGL